MKALFIASCLFLLSGCSYFDETNPVGGRLARSRDLDRSVSTVSVPLSEGHGIQEAYSRKKLGAWSSSGVCRTGFYEKDTFYACLEFSISGIPRDFDSLRDEGMPDSLDSLHGIDAMSLMVRLENNSAYAYDSLEYDLIFMQCRIVSRSMSGGIVRRLDDGLVPLDTQHLHLVAPAEDASFAIPLTDTNEALFNYFRRAVLERGGSDSAAVGLAIRCADSDTGKPVLTFNSAEPAVLTLFGHYRPVHYTYINGVKVWGHGDSLVTDSVKSRVTISAYSGLTADSSSFFIRHPVASTVYYQGTDSLDTAGYYCAVFKVRKDSIFRGLNRDSINVLKASAFLMLDQDSSFSEAGRSVDLRLQCLFYGTGGGLVLPTENVYLLPDTLVKAFPAPDSASLCFPIDKYLAALTDPRYDGVALIEFNVQSNPSSFGRMSRLTFKKEVRIDFEYSER